MAVESGRKAMQLAKATDPNRGWFLVTAAMAALCAGKPAESERLANEALARADGNRECRGLALAYRALARLRLDGTIQSGWKGRRSGCLRRTRSERGAYQLPDT